MGTGSRGGVGRYEQLLQAALNELTARGELEWRGTWRRPHPDYLGPSEASDAPHSGSLTELLRRIASSTRRWQPDLVIFTHVNLARLGPLLPLLGIRAPYAIGALGVEMWSRVDWTRRRALLRAANVFSISSYTRNKVHTLQGIPLGRCSTLHLALEDHWRVAARARTRDSILAQRPEESRGVSLLSVCRLEEDARDKGVDWVLTALAQLAPTHPTLGYTIVGDGNDRSRLEDMAIALGIGERVLFTGSVGHDGLLDAYRDCDLFVLPSRREGFGLVFLEAMAFRKPIIAVASRGTLDVVTSGKEGLLIETSADLARAIAAIVADRALGERLGEAGYRSVSDHFSFGAFVGRLSALITAVVGAAPRPAHLDRPTGVAQ